MKKIIPFLLILFVCHSSFAQDKHEQIRSLKIAHLTTQLNLSDTESEKFWTVYTAYDKKMGELRHNDIVKYIKSNTVEDLNQLSESDASKRLKELVEFENTYFSTRKKFIEDAKKIIGDKKTLILKKAEDDFNKKLLKKYKEKK